MRARNRLDVIGQPFDQPLFAGPLRLPDQARKWKCISLSLPRDHVIECLAASFAFCTSLNRPSRHHSLHVLHHPIFIVSRPPALKCELNEPTHFEMTSSPKRGNLFFIEQTHPKNVPAEGTRIGGFDALLRSSPVTRPMPPPRARSISDLPSSFLDFHPIRATPPIRFIADSAHRNFTKKPNEATARLQKTLQRLPNAVFIPPRTLFFDETNPPRRFSILDLQPSIFGARAIRATPTVQ
jgi:hypothetical protein